MVKTIKIPLMLIVFLAILFVSIFSIAVSIIEHENLYRESVKQDLDGLSENLSNDIVTILATANNEIELTTILLRLDRYENVKFAYVFSIDGELLSRYFGKQAEAEDPLSNPVLSQILKQHQLGMSIDNNQLVALKMIGDKRLPQGYLFIVNDLKKPLESSKHLMFSSIFPLTVFIVIIALLSLYFLLNRLLSPLSRLSKFANKVSLTHNYSLKPDIEGKYEIAQLSTDIEQMMGTIDTQMERNKDYTQQLIAQQKAMEKLANFDSLTGLPNRQFFVEMLRVELIRAKRENSDVALLFFDLDGFKDVNDSFGHEVGDKLLIKIATLVKNYVRDGDVISRLGGDEFLVLLHNNPDEFTLVNIADRIATGLSKTIKIEEWQVNVSASIGIAKASQSNFNVSEFISNADLAMYRSKLEGKGRYTIFVEEMMEGNKRKLLIAKNIDDALLHNSFCLFYQPKVNDLGVVNGYEALIRWYDNELGFISPVEFIPIAEKSGKINAVTSWVLKRLCTEFSELQRKHIEPVKVSVNLSAIDIKNEHLFDEIQALFIDFNIDPSLIEFEVTESAYLENLKEANLFFSRLQELGSTIALDDFGTGYSSLAYLTQIKLNTLKIDKQFVDNLGESDRSNLITVAIIDMANRLQLQTCAEGVETRLQADFLISQGCQQLQGYLFGRPLSIKDLTEKMP
ncbi:EAL domain-containing protein [Alteromonadaceae bacterium BrNp21-10]|nr:EAL domain-containing protein [Alteromonadaceae bacterium BrNp21-10]